MSANVTDSISIILAIGTVTSPVVFGAFLWRLSKVFVTKIDFDDFKKERHESDEREDKRFKIIEADIKTILSGGNHK